MNENEQFRELIDDIQSLPEPDYENEFDMKTRDRIHENIINFSMDYRNKRRRGIIGKRVLAGITSAIALLLFTFVFLTINDGEKTATDPNEQHNLDEEHLVGLQGNEYEEGQYPIHMTYDLNAVKRYVNNQPDNGEEIRSLFKQMSNDSVKFDLQRELTSEEWEKVKQDLNSKLDILNSLISDNSDFNQPIHLFIKFLEEAKGEDYLRYEDVVNGIEFLSKELN
ncbi:hypothetical protein [Tenuibacillus multivorans]|nr:hypothetical protein [Tenuibacillus multivorans]GEL76594.1 hypothetical protein TMU01_08290 [Tenuibacillus multivorans]